MTTRRHRGDGSLYQQRDGLWCATIDLGVGGDGKRRRRKVRSKDYATAVRKLRDLRRQVEDGTLATTRNTTVAQWLEHWLDTVARPRNKPKTYAGYRSAVHAQLIPQIGAYRLDRLTPAHVRTMHLALAKRGLVASSILKTHAVLRKALTDAVREGLVVRNVATLVDAPRKNESARGALTAAQAIALLRASDEAGDGMTSRWAAALMLGARQGELLGLTWDRVNLITEEVDVAWQLQEIPYRHGCGGSCGKRRAGSCPKREFDVNTDFVLHPLVDNLALTRPKSRVGRRVIPLPPPLASLLRQYQTTSAPNIYGLVWTVGGKPIRPKPDLARWKAALARAGLPEVPLHVARHSTATLLMGAGVDTHIIESIMGHSSTAATKAYLHADRSMQRTAMAGLDALLALD